MSEYYQSHDGDIWQAADYALGALKPGDRISAEKRLLNDPVFRQSVEHWQGVFAGLADDIEPIAPRSDVWRQIKLATKPTNVSAQVATMPKDQTGLWQTATSFLSLVCLALLGLLIYLTGGDFRPNSHLQKRLAQVEKDYEKLSSENAIRDSKLEYSLNETNAVEEELIATNLALVELSQKYELSQKNLELANYKLENIEKELEVQVRQLELKDKEVDAYVKELDINAQEIDTYAKALESNADEIDALRAAISKVNPSASSVAEQTSVDEAEPLATAPTTEAQTPQGGVPVPSPRSSKKRGVAPADIVGLKVSFDSSGKALELGTDTSALQVREPEVYFTPDQGARAGEPVAFGPIDLDMTTGMTLSDEFAELVTGGGTITLVAGSGAFKTTLAKGALKQN